MGTLYDEYTTFVSKYREDYGENLAVLYEVGSFLEWYNCDNNLGCNVRKICAVLNVQATRRNKNIEIVSKANPEMGGIPRAALSKYLPLLLDAQYTVVLVSQTTPPPNPKREVTNVISKGTYLDGILNESGFIPMRLACVFVDVFTEEESLFGFCSIDTSTGDVVAFECYNARSMCSYDDIRRFVSQYQPIELVLVGKHSKNQEYSSSICAFVKKLNRRCQVHDWTGETTATKRYVGSLYNQNEALRKIYPRTGFLSPVEFCGLERKPAASTAFAVLADFCYQHNEAIIAKIGAPRIMEPEGALILQHNALCQLNVLPMSTQKDDDEREKSLIHILDKCVTAMGKRFFRYMLLNPITCVTELNKRYDIICAMLEDGNDAGTGCRYAYQNVRIALEYGAYDVERICRKVKMKRVQPKEIPMLIDSIQVILNLREREPCTLQMCNTLSDDSTLLDIDALNDLRQFLVSTFVVDDIYRLHSANDATVNIFKVGLFPALDTLFDTCATCYCIFEKVTNKLNNIHGSGNFKLESSDMGDLFIVSTMKRFSAAKEALDRWPDDCTKVTGMWGILNDGEMDGPEWTVYQRDVVYSRLGGASSTSVMLEHPVLRIVADRARWARRSLSTELNASFSNVLDTIEGRFGEILADTAMLLKRLDFFSTCALNAHELRHVRPNLQCEASSSFVDVKQLRHPIIEAVNSNIPHVPNDVCLGTPQHQGILLYGVNAAGKSSLMKACGIAIVMAQCGMFVAATEMLLHPYERLMTRIYNHDNIFANQSTFMAEVSELRDIITKGDSLSLVLGDEVCSGTESVSATSIVGAVLQRLTDAGSSYIFATHLHELIDVHQVQSLRGLKVYHLSVRMDNGTGELIYDRRLAPGKGSDLYGLEVCQALGMPMNFMKMANSIRRALLSGQNMFHEGEGPLDSPKKSAYNRQLSVDNCAVCSARATEVHHIQHQKDADIDGYIGHHHKNRLSNLAPLCDRCHSDAHRGLLTIKGFVQTSSGVRLDFARHSKQQLDVQPAPTPGRDVTDAMYESAINMKRFGFSVKRIVSVLSERFKDQRVTRYTVNKLLASYQG